MLPFVRIRSEAFLPVMPRHLSDPSESIFLQLSGLLFNYSPELAGIPLTFHVEGVVPQGRILDDGSVYINVLITFCVLKLVPDSYILAKDGLCMNVFQCVVDGDESYTGKFRVKEIKQPLQIVGTLLVERDF